MLIVQRYTNSSNWQRDADLHGQSRSGQTLKASGKQRTRR